MAEGDMAEGDMARDMVQRIAVLKAGLWIWATLTVALGVGLAALSAPAQGACRIAVLGDSLTAGYGIDLAEAFPAQLERRLKDEGYHCAVLDAGVSGDTSAGGLVRLDWLLADRPSHVIVELGANDALRALPPEELESNLDAIVDRLRSEGVEVLLAGMLAPPNLGREYGERFAGVFPRVAEDNDVPLYPFFLDGVAADPALNQPDGIHPTAEGVGVIVERMLPTITDWLDRARG
jgi:acyl-CoA thioesterase-1